MEHLLRQRSAKKFHMERPKPANAIRNVTLSLTANQEINFEIIKNDLFILILPPIYGDRKGNWKPCPRCSIVRSTICWNSEEVNPLNKEKLDRLADALLEFVERTAQKATSETEVQALPEVASVLVEIFKIQ